MDEFEQQYFAILERQQCSQKKEMAISGKDLIAAGMKPGKEMGRVLDGLFEMVLDSPELNEKSKLLELAHKI